jgi:hypothetical protein
MDINSLSNEFCYIEMKDEAKDFFGRDITDPWNEPSFFNRTRRSYRKAKAALIAEFTERTTMRGAINILVANGIQCHSYCAVD